MSSLAPIDDINIKIFDEIFEERFSALELDVILVTIIDNLPSDALPHLAEQFHILGDEGWNFAQTEQEKRNLLKKALEIHKYKGTKYALLKVFETLNISGTIQEWFEYGGNPYFFKVILNIFDRGLSDDLEQQLLRLINKFKNVRSKLETIELFLTAKCTQNIYSYLLLGETITINAKDV